MKYVGKRVVSFVITILAASFVVFMAFSLLSGDPAVSKLGTNATPEALAALREEMGLNRPLLIRYFEWLGGLFTLNFGDSYSYSIPVTKLILERIPINLCLSVMSLLFVILISFPIGILSAKHVGSWFDKVLMVVNQVLMAIPPFFMGLLLTYLFGMMLHFFSPGRYVSYQDNFAGFVWYLVCPAFALALPKCAMTVRLLRSSILSESKLDYVRTAYSRGNDTNRMLFQHVLKNAVMPTITFLGMLFADMIASGIIIEQVFSIPGLGRILLSSIATRDYPVVQAIVMVIAGGVLLVGFLVDIIYKRMDPRVDTE